MAKAKEIEGLDCEGDAFANIDLILRTRLGEMCELNAKAQDWSDIEGVHDMRVASRRLRSLMRDFAPYVNEGKSPRRQVKEIARSLGSVRDEDVAIAALKKLRKRMKGEVADGIKHLIEERRKRQASAQEALALVISDEAVVQLQEDFAAWLQDAAAVRANEKSGTPLTFRAMGREVIQSQYDELDALSKSLFNPFDVEPLHEMRIAAKRLRYSLELFSPCFGEGLTELAKEIAELQTSLGELHDCDVWIEELGAKLKARASGGDEASGDKSSTPYTPEDSSTTWLLRHFVKERTKHYSAALSRWSEWQSTGFEEKLKEHLQETPQPRATDSE